MRSEVQKLVSVVLNSDVGWTEKGKASVVDSLQMGLEISYPNLCLLLEVAIGSRDPALHVFVLEMARKNSTFCAIHGGI